MVYHGKKESLICLFIPRAIDHKRPGLPFRRNTLEAHTRQWLGINGNDFLSRVVESKAEGNGDRIKFNANAETGAS